MKIMIKKFWTPEEIDILAELVTQEYSNEQIAKKLNRTKDSVAAKKARLDLCKTYTKYSDEELLDLLRKDNYPSSNEYTKRKDRPYHKVYQKRFGSWSRAIELAGGVPNPTGSACKWTDEELLTILTNEKTYLTRESFNSIKEYPSYQVYQKRFGSWNQALKLAGHDPNRFGFKPEAPTILYLIYFIEEDIYKIGITQQSSIYSRFIGYPKYIIISENILKLNIALDLEKEWLNEVETFKTIPQNFPKGKGGHTECFRVPNNKNLVIDFPEIRIE